jgi:hypothetical protein
MHRTRVLIAIGIAIAAAAPLVVGPTRATPPSGVTSPPEIVGRFDGIHTTARTDVDPGRKTDYWRARINVKGATDVHILENDIAPGGTFGWHSHPGPSLVIVSAGMLSVYHAPDCMRMDYGPGSPLGSTFVDGGHDTHMVRNNGTVEADVHVISIVPAGFLRRIDEDNPNPGVCPD